jgi:hypothetical protein
MECPFCCFLRNYIGQYVRVGIVVNCASDNTSYNHRYNDGYIQRSSFFDNAIRLYDAPRGGNVIFTACCDDIFELYLFDTVGETTETIKNIDISTMNEQRLYLFNTIQSSTKEEAKANE